MTALTGVQSAALDAWRDHRIVVVRACPGSGKTRVFVDAMRDELARVGGSRRGVAALSFTNVAQDEIVRRLGARVGPSSFVGTVDAFLWRFVVVPFGHLVGVRREGPRLVPAPVEATLARPEIQYGTARERASLFQCRLKRAPAGGVAVEIKTRIGRVQANPGQVNLIETEKRKIWARSGFLTHSDASFVASEVLASKHGGSIRDVISKRFLSLLVDECQDTGGFMAEALLGLLDGSSMRAFVVGDPDQSIYGFGGGTKDIMERIGALPGAVLRELNETHRCSRAVARVATALSRRGATVAPRDNAPEGRAILVVHQHPEARVDDVLAALRRGGVRPAADTMTVLVRKNATLSRLREPNLSRFPLSPRVAERFARAATALRGGDARAAFTIASHTLADLVLEDAPHDDVLRASGIDRRRWRRAVHAVLQEAARDWGGRTWGAWRGALKSKCGEVAIELGHPLEPRRLSAALKAGTGDDVAWSRSVEATPVVAADDLVAFDSIHGAKGQEFDVVVVYAPKPHGTRSPCPSTEWWSSTTDAEEREVAFVAVSRAKTTLVLAVHERTADALRGERPAFVALFEEIRLGGSAGSGVEILSAP